jgi:alpha,alpha-trehalase
MTGVVEFTRERFDGVIFDLDGVVTRTASVHAAAWKQLFDEYREERLNRDLPVYDPFDAGDDYREYVDGKPRYDGIESFLGARGIELPRGDPDDPSDAETICGLGNRKNELFREELESVGVRVFESTIRLIEDLRAEGFKVAIISASKNCALVLEAAGIQDLFHARVDGVEAGKLGLAGKPAPDVFVEAARRLGVEPDRSVVVEDALAGVRAGHDGGFALVIGVNRGGDPERLRGNGADVVVSDLEEVTVGRSSDPPVRSAAELPSALERVAESAAFRAKRLAVFLDFDGTLSPIVANPEDAALSEELRDTIRRLARVCPVAIVSGRDLDDVRERVGLEEIVYAGSHGFDIAGPGGLRLENPEAQEYLPVLDEAELALREKLADIAGVRVERKKYAIAIHFRNADEEREPDVERVVDGVGARHARLRLGRGKKIFELQPAIDWHKGRAVDWLLDALDLKGFDVLPMYLGDDVTDEDAFRTLSGRGLGIVVRDEPRPTAAEFALESPAEVASFLDKLVRHREALAAWTLIYEGFDPGKVGLREALCTVGNGYFATRGAAPESAADGVHYPGTYLAGGYNRLTTEIAGRSVENEDLVNLPNWLALSFRFDDGDWFDPGSVEILACRQELDLRCGVLARRIRFRDAQGRRTLVTQRRIVSMADMHLAALETTWRPENWSGRLEVRSALDGRVENRGVERYGNLESRHLVANGAAERDDGTITLKSRTSQSNFDIALAARTRWSRAGESFDPPGRTEGERGWIARDFTVDVQEGEEVRLEKVVALFTSRDQAISECGLAAGDAAREAEDFSGLLDRHEEAWRQLWERFDMEMEFATPPSEGNNPALTLHLHIFHLLQTTSPHTIELDAGVPSRGWHGEAYRGHVFWDELFIFPLLNYRAPDITRALLKYRYRRLDAARRGARAAGHVGAMYPWQSGSDGREESQVVHLNPQSGRWLPDNSHLQRHINAAVVYNVWQYYQTSGDREFLFSHGAEMMLEIARFWAGLATWNEALERYEICGVMGPDEYHDADPDAAEPGLDNNSYTNLMAVWVLCRALDLFELIPGEHCSRLCRVLGVTDDEIRHWQDVSRRMRLVFHGDGILSQFEGYEDLEEFDWPTYRERHGQVMRLDRILEAEDDTPNRYKASKQADVLMLFYLFSTEELGQLFERLGYPFDPEMIPRNIDYYLARTSNGSTLSDVVNSWVLARSDRARSWDLFIEALRSDVADVQGGTTPEGIHLGAMAGTVDLMQRCYMGIEMRDEMLWVNPQLPDELSRLRLRIRYHEASLSLTADRDNLEIRVLHCPGEPLRIGVGGRVMELKEGEEIAMTLADCAATISPASPSNDG